MREDFRTGGGLGLDTGGKGKALEGKGGGISIGDSGRGPVKWPLNFPSVMDVVREGIGGVSKLFLVGVWPLCGTKMEVRKGSYS